MMVFLQKHDFISGGLNQIRKSCISPIFVKGLTWVVILSLATKECSPFSLTLISVWRDTGYT